jgi:Putative DNA-binding domain
LRKPACGVGQALEINVLFLNTPQNAEDIRKFCSQFSEGIRVEYKSTFDTSVRSKLAKIVSSFANSLGGVLLIGVNAPEGTPLEPIEGFDTPNEELTLTVEQLCLQGINPPVIPKITVIRSDIPEKSFLVIEVDESPESPHAIENQKKVYVRTGNATNPYDLADVDLIIERFTRRSALQKNRSEIIHRQSDRTRAMLVSEPDEMLVQISIGPVYPRRQLVPRDSTWTFAMGQQYRGVGFIPHDSVRRTNDGVAGTNFRKSECIDLSSYGFVLLSQFVRSRLVQPDLPTSRGWLFGDLLNPLSKALVLSASLYRHMQYRGTVQIDASIFNCEGKPMPFLDHWPDQFTLDDFRSLEETISAQTTTDTETLPNIIPDLTQTLISQICWSFWQPYYPFPEDALARYIASAAQR